MHEWCGNIVLQLDDGEPQRGDGENLRTVNRSVPLKLSCRCHAELVREMPSLVVVLMGDTLKSGTDFKSVKEQQCFAVAAVLLASLCWCLLRARALALYWLW